MSATKPTTTNSEKPSGYKQKLVAARKLRANSAKNNYHRVQLLVEVFDDRDFRSDLGNVDDFAAGKALDPEVNDLGFEFLQLRAILQRFPRTVDWQGHLLVEMYQTVLDERVKPDGEAVPRRRRVVTKAEYEELEAKHQQLETQMVTLRPLEDEVDILRERLRRAYDRIHELELELEEAKAANLVAA